MFFVGLGRVARARKLSPKSVEHLGEICRKRGPRGTFLEALGCPGGAFGGSRGGLGTGTRKETRGIEFLGVHGGRLGDPCGAFGRPLRSILASRGRLFYHLFPLSIFYRFWDGFGMDFVWILNGFGIHFGIDFSICSKTTKL